MASISKSLRLLTQRRNIMQISKKGVLAGLTSLAVATLTHAAYVPGSPAFLNAVPAGFIACGTDGKVCKAPAGVSTVYVLYGAGTKFATAQGSGDFTCLPKGWVKNPSASTPIDLGIDDPVPGAAKTCYIQTPGASSTSGTQAPKSTTATTAGTPTTTAAQTSTTTAPKTTQTAAPAALTEADKAQIKTLFSSYSACKSGFDRQMKMNFWYQEHGGFVWNNAKKGNGTFDSDSKLGTANSQFKSSLNELKSKMDKQDKAIVVNSVANAKLLADACATNATEAQTLFQGAYQNRDAIYAAACKDNAKLAYCDKNAYAKQYPQTWK